MSKIRLIAILTLVCCCVAADAQASQTVALKVGFSPNRLGASTTIQFGFQVAGSGGQVPSPVTSVDLHLPAGMELGSATLGLATCSRAVLQERGVAGCSPNALMGMGRASVEVPFESGLVNEEVSISELMAPPMNEHTTVLFYAVGSTPIAAALVFPGEFLSDSGPFGGRLEITIPPTLSTPGAPSVAVTSLQSSIGPEHLTYYKRVHGKKVAYRPAGVEIPRRCPSGGFPFAADFSFQDGTTTRAKATVACPPRVVKHRHSRARSKQ